MPSLQLPQWLLLLLQLLQVEVLKGWLTWRVLSMLREAGTGQGWCAERRKRREE